ncbi:hypothetical protein BOTBODRAFT_179142 [Botryobasidium botryosum FD-172 SS1]|uniref:Uncharacterized protein n=1 Tax=Botryobasidium botryosum (strain FD-172 SS1) TaxID=930990 RepID=A0A067MBP5_BOTB1|nr:hypothetical protein BOTBODRAFT_179142 [Botryobasidium botryosum FD-172 SS1]
MRHHNAANWRPGQARQAVSYTLATSSGARPNPTPKRISPFLSRKGSNKTATNEATFKPQGRVALQTHGTAVINCFNNSAQASAIEACVTSVSWSRNGNVILTPQEGISLTTLRMEACPILNVVFGVPFRALFPGEIFSATVRDITLCYGTQGDRYTVDELVVQIVRVVQVRKGLDRVRVGTEDPQGPDTRRRTSDFWSRRRRLRSRCWARTNGGKDEILTLLHP